MKTKSPQNRLKDVPTQIKNPELVIKRRRQIVDAAVHLFIENGFHKTTTRQIAGAAGFSIGSLYEYVASKEDVLYLVCDAIHHEVERGVNEALARTSDGEAALTEMIREYILVCDRMRDHLLLIYQETKSLPKQWRRRVLENEVRITNIFTNVLKNIRASGEMADMDDATLELIAHNITVLGHMWTFRRWFLDRKYTIEDYAKIQTDFILGLSIGRKKE